MSLHKPGLFSGPNFRYLKVPLSFVQYESKKTYECPVIIMLKKETESVSQRWIGFRNV